MRPYETPAAERAASLFDAEARHWPQSHVKENLRFACKREAGGEEGALESVVAHYYKPGQRAGVLEHLQRIVRSAVREPSS